MHLCSYAKVRCTTPSHKALSLMGLQPIFDC